MTEFLKYRQTYDSSTNTSTNCKYISLSIIIPSLGYRCAYFRPGAGKSTIADKVVSLLNDNGYTSAASSIQQCNDTKHHEYLALDLDVCVSQTMRVSFMNHTLQSLIYSNSLSNHNTN